MIIDFHTHTYPDRIAAKTVGLLESRSESAQDEKELIDEEQTCGCVCGTSGGNVSETI